MRDILFRGKRIDNDYWVTGTPFIEANCCKMITAVALHPDFVDEGNVYFSEGFPVRQETVGQYTGLTDKNGRKIFEGDIVTGTAYSSECIGVIVWIDEIATFGVRYFLRTDPTAWENSSILKAVSVGRQDNYAAQIIGNIYDNPELLENNNLEEHKNG